jgi:hypothetical protein
VLSFSKYIKKTHFVFPGLNSDPSRFQGKKVYCRHAACMELRTNAFKYFVVKPLGKKSLRCIGGGKISRWTLETY